MGSIEPKEGPKKEVKKDEPIVEEQKPMLTENDFDSLETWFKFVRGNHIVIDNEGLMADAINFKSDFFTRMRNTLDALEEPPEK